MPFGYIYKIVFPNGKHYIGLTTSLEQRTKQHKCRAKSDNTRYLYNALRKYDMIDTLELIEIDTANTEEELCEKEIEYILLYNSYYMNGNGYNMTYGGDGTAGYVYTEEDRQKQSERGKKYYEEHPDAREQMRKIMKKHYEENPEAIKKYYEEHPEAREKQSKKMKKYHQEHPEAREKNREAQQKYYEEHPEAREKQSEKMKKYFENPDAREQMSKIKKKYHQVHPQDGKEHGEKMKKYFENNPDARQKLSDGKGKNNPFDVFTKDEIFIKTFSYQFEAKEYLQKEYNITSTFNISRVLSGSNKSSAGFVFKYK